jgi:hypothetical protein
MSLAKILGTLGKGLTNTTTSLWGTQGPTLAPGGLGAQWQQKGAQAMTTPERIDHMMRTTGSFVPGDYSTAVAMGYDPGYTVGIPNKDGVGSGGILTDDQVRRNEITRQLSEQDRFDKTKDPGDGYGWHGDDSGWKPEGGTDGDDVNNFENLLRIAQQQHAIEMQGIDRAYQLAQQRRDQGLGAVKAREGQFSTLRDEDLGRIEAKRGEFGELKDEDIFNIVQNFEDSKGGARRTASDLNLQAGNRARASGGVNMSKMMGVPSRMDELLARQMGNINTARSGEERGAQRLYDERLGWADQQDSNIGQTFNDRMAWALQQQQAIDNAYQEAANQRNMASGLSANSFVNNLSGLQSSMQGYGGNIANQSSALQNMLGQINAYQANPMEINYKTNPYDINMGGIQSILSQAMTGGAGQQVGGVGPQTANLNMQNQPIIDELLKNQVPGGSLYAQSST